MKRKRSSMEPLGEVQIEPLETSENQASPPHVESQKELFPGPPGSPLSGETFLEFSTTIDPPSPESPQPMEPEAVGEGEAELLSPSKNKKAASPPVEDFRYWVREYVEPPDSPRLWPLQCRDTEIGLAAGLLVEPSFGKTPDEAFSIAKIVDAEAYDKAMAAYMSGLSCKSTFRLYHHEVVTQIFDKYALARPEWDFDLNKPKTLPGQGSTSSQQQRDSGMSLLEYFLSPETQALLSDKDKLSQLVEQNPKLMEMFKEKLEQQSNGSSHVSSMVECDM